MKKNKKQNKGNDNKVIYGILINKVEKNGKYVIPNMVKKSSSSKLSAYATYVHKLMRKELIIISKKNNLKLFKTLSKIFNDKISYILVAKDIMDEAIDIVVNKKIKTFKLHTRLSLKEHYELIKKRRKITTPAFFFIDSFTGPGSYSGRGIMSSAQFDNMFTATGELVNKHAEANGECSELLNPKVGKEDDADNEEVVIIYRHDGVDPTGKKAARICSYRKCKKEDVRTVLRKHHEGDVFNIIEKNSKLHNLLLEKLESPSMELTGPSSSKNFIIYIQDELLYNIGSISEKDRLSCKYRMYASIGDLAFQYFPIPEQFISGKIKVLTQQQDARQIHMPIKIDKGKCTFKFNVGGFTEKDCSLSELVDKLNDSKVKCGDNISAEIKIPHYELEMSLINKIAEILNSDCSVSSSLIANDKVAMILHEVEHYEIAKNKINDFEGDTINTIHDVLLRNPEMPRCNKKAVHVTKLCQEIELAGKYILNGSNDLGMNAEIIPYIGKKVVVTKIHKNGLFSIMCSGLDGKVFNGIAKYNLTPLLKEDSDSMENFDGVAPKKTTLSKILAKNILEGIEILKNNSDVKDDDKRVNYTPECSIPLADKEIASKTVEEVSEYLDNTEYDAIINNIKINISKEYMTEKTDGRIILFFPKDFRERLCDLSYLPDLENRFKQFSNIGILQQELLLKSEDKDILESIGELTFAQVLELFTVLADMKGMIKIKDEESGEYCLKHPEKKAELIVNDIKVADITDIKISKMGVLLLTASDTVGEFGRDSKNCAWELFANLEEAIDKLKKTNTEEKVYTLLKYQSGANTVFSNIVPRISKASFGNVFAVLLDADTLFYYRNELNPNVEEIGLSCKPINLKKEHNVRLRNKYWAHLAIEIKEEDIKTKISIQPYIKKTKTIDIEKQALVDEDEYLKVINFINNNVPAERLSNNIIFYRYDIVVPKDFKERITSLLDSPDYKNKFKFISDPHQCLIGILYLTTSDIDIAHHHLGKLTFEQLLELFTILADVSLDAPVELGELNANSQAQDRTKRARPTNMKVEVYPTTTSAEEGEVNPLTNDEVIEKIKRDLTEPAIEPNMDDLLKYSEIPKIKNEFTGVGIIAAVKDNLDVKEEENDELVFIICPKGEASYDIIWKTKKELDSDENLNNYRAKSINPQTQLFNLIKNDLLNLKHIPSLTREQICGVTKIYVPSHTIGLHYKIAEDVSNNLTVEILFSYSQTSYDEFENLEALRSKRRYQGFYDFENK